LPADAQKAEVKRVGLDRMIAEAEKNRDRRLHEAADARGIVDEALVNFRNRLIDRILSPLFAAIQRRYRQAALEGVDRLFRKELSDLKEDEREVVRRWAEIMARRFAHLPTAGLRGVAFDVGSSGVEAFLARADETMLKMLRDISRQTDIPSVSEEEEVA
jgi:glutamyl-tRNA reductase